MRGATAAAVAVVLSSLLCSTADSAEAGRVEDGHGHGDGHETVHGHVHGHRRLQQQAPLRSCDVSNDWDGDGRVDVDDLLSLLGAFGMTADPGVMRADISPSPNGDGRVDVTVRAALPAPRSAQRRTDCT